VTPREYAQKLEKRRRAASERLFDRIVRVNHLAEQRQAALAAAPIVRHLWRGRVFRPLTPKGTIWRWRLARRAA
jgi:hypothetical protein